MIRFAPFIQVTAKVIIALTLLVLAGWLFDIRAFLTIFPGMVGMNPFTALSFMAIAVWLLFYLRGSGMAAGPAYTVQLTLAVFVLLVGGLRLLDMVAGTNYGFDNLLSVSNLAYGFISPLTAFSITLIALAMLLEPVLNRLPNLVLFILIPVFLLSICSLFGYIIGENDILTLRPFKPMALHTTLCFLALVICFLFLFSQNIFTRTVLSRYSGGHLARRLLPFIILVPMVLGFLRYQGERYGLYDVGFGVAILVVGAVFIFLVVVVHQSNHLSVSDQKRTVAENKVQKHAQELECANRELEQRNKELEQFTFVTNHDLQEPLRKIILFTGMVKADSYDRLTEASQKRFDRIEVAAHRMKEALKDVLEYASLDREEQFQSVNLNEIVRDVQTDLEATIHEKAAAIQANELPSIKAVPSQMHQLFYNLVGNALKFSKEGQPPQIRISCKELTDTVPMEQQEQEERKRFYEITVSDSGIGFNPEAAEKIFVLFQRLHSKEAYSGTGIGLALCKKVVQNHRGKIWAEGIPGTGAAFHVLLPGE